jgi:outer membrane protein insertion porin family
VVVLLFGLVLVGPAPARAQGGQQARGTVSAVQVDSIAIQGNTRLEAPVILGTLGFQAGSEVTYREIQRGIKALWSTGQFSDIQVRARGNPDEPVLLILDVEEQEIVRRITIAGLEHADEGEVRDTADLRTGLPYSPRKVNDARAFIRAELASEGIPFARIEERKEPFEDEPGQIHLILDVTEGNRITVAQVEVRGNEEVEEDEILGAMTTKPEGFFWFRTGSYDAEAYEEDLNRNIPNVYRALGYLDFQVVSDSLVIDPQTGKTRVQLEVEEGRRYRLADFTIEGNRHFSTEDLRRYFSTEGGGLLEALGFGSEEDSDERPFFDAQAFEEAIGRVQQAYSNDGYIYADVQPWVRRVETTEDENPAVEVGWDIREGNPAYVNRILISGNDFTHERVIRERIYILPGDVYSMDEVLNSYQSISALGFFVTPLPEPDIEPDPQTGDVDITFNVEEKQTGSINFGTAVGGGTGVSGFLGYDQPNLFGQAKEGHLRWDFGRYINSFTVSFSDPALFQSRVSGTISLFNSRDRFFQFQSGRRKRMGFSLRFGVPVPWALRTRVFAGYTLARTEYQLFESVDDTSLFGLPPGTRSTFSLGITRTTLNHPLFPTSGSRQSLNSEFSGGILGGDGEFSRYTGDASWWVPAGQFGGEEPGSRPIRLALGLTLRGGAIFGEVERFPFERFWMGGVMFGQELRGYDETSITPLGFFPERSRDLRDIDRLGNAFASFTAEYAIRFNDNLSMSTFFDAGNVWAHPLDADFGRLFRGAGIGVQLVTPFGPIGLDYAYGFDKTNPGWQLHFRMGPGY